tara:strand:+ start:384 stop:554 length:171 start_codon:yes stop_codon:yes gene_type:complete
MAKFKVTQQIVNRGGKRYIAENGVIEVDASDVSNFAGFIEIKKTKNENTKKDNKGM